MELWGGEVAEGKLTGVTMYSIMIFWHHRRIAY